MHGGVPHDLTLEEFELLSGREIAIYKEVCGLKVGRLVQMYNTKVVYLPFTQKDQVVVSNLVALGSFGGLRE